MVSLEATSLIPLPVFALCTQFPDWKRRFDYTVVEVKMDVLQTYLKDNVPKPLSLTKCAEMKDEDLSVGNTVQIVHYPKKSETYDRHENPEQISIIDGKPCKFLALKVACIHIHMGTSTLHLQTPPSLYFLIIAGPYIGHLAESFPGSSGSPILREYNNELIVVGLHRGDLGSQGHTLINVATLITVILDDIRTVPYNDSKCKWH